MYSPTKAIGPGKPVPSPLFHQISLDIELHDVRFSMDTPVVLKTRMPSRACLTLAVSTTPGSWRASTDEHAGLPSGSVPGPCVEEKLVPSPMTLLRAMPRRCRPALVM